MIVKKIDPSWQLIFQPAHALLSGKIAQCLSTKIDCHSRFETMIAIATHDDYPEEFLSNEYKYVSVSGAPRDFTEMDMSDSLRFDEAMLTIETAYRKSQWIGLLRSFHAHTLYADEDVTAKFKSFLQQEVDHRKKVLRRLKLNVKDLEYAYSVMQFCDRCSLILCKSQLPEMERKLEISKMCGTQYTICQRKDETICVDPWPFSEHAFGLSVLSFTIDQLSFTDDATLGDALSAVTPQPQEFNFHLG